MRERVIRAVSQKKDSPAFLFDEGVAPARRAAEAGSRPGDAFNSVIADPGDFRRSVLVDHMAMPMMVVVMVMVMMDHAVGRHDNRLSLSGER
jgi:hypothetical protein